MTIFNQIIDFLDFNLQQGSQCKDIIKNKIKFSTIRSSTANNNNNNNLETNNLNKTGLLLILSNLSKKVPNRVKFVLK